LGICTGKGFYSKLLEPIGRRGYRKLACPSRGTGCEGQGLQMEACTKYVGEMALCRSEEGEQWDGSDQILCFRRLSPFFKHVQIGFPGFA